MATISVKFRTPAMPDKAGTLYFQIIHRRQSCRIATGIRLSPPDWERIRTGRTDGPLLPLANRIGIGMARLRGIVGELERTGRPYTACEVAGRYRSQAAMPSFLTFMRQQIALKRELGRHGTADNYTSALRSFAAFLDQRDIAIADLTGQLVEQYAVHLARSGVSRNSASFYQRNLRAVYNKAVRLRLADQATPFAEAYTGVDKTCKRAVDERTIRQLYRLDLKAKPRLALARDMFIFSYCARGMAFVDMAYLQKKDFTDNAFEYARRKTGQQLRVQAVRPLRDIAERYMSRNRDYVFPVITAAEAAQAYRQYRAGINEYNRRLKMLSRLLPGAPRLMSYTARHSWATIAQRNHAVPVSVISAALGHTTETTTRIYLESLENSVIDHANESIIAALDK